MRFSASRSRRGIGGGGEGLSPITMSPKEILEAESWLAYEKEAKPSGGLLGGDWGGRWAVKMIPAIERGVHGEGRLRRGILENFLILFFALFVTCC